MYKKYKTVYKVLDDFDEVVKVMSYKPNDCFKYVKEKVLIVYISLLEDALF